MKQQINVRRLKEILKDIDDEYVVQLGINEESDLLSHIFIDNDCGVVDLTNFDDEEENKPVVAFDCYGDDIHIGDKVLFYQANHNFIKGHIMFDKVLYALENDGNKRTTISRGEKNTQILRYEW